jgi:hypothetical protein
VLEQSDDSRRNARAMALVFDELERRYAPRANWDAVARDFAATLEPFA